MTTSTRALPEKIYSSSDIRLGEIWQHRKNKRTCVIRALTSSGISSKVQLEHVASGIKSTKKVHYFVYDFEPADAAASVLALAALAQPKPVEATFTDVRDGSVWKHRKTKRSCTVRSNAKGGWDDVVLEHETGRRTTKGVNYFLGEFDLVSKAPE